jgi:hypothetical protein
LFVMHMWLIQEKQLYIHISHMFTVLQKKQT